MADYYYKYRCGCEIGGRAPEVEHIWLCGEHRYLRERLKESAPSTFKKLIEER